MDERGAAMRNGPAYDTGFTEITQTKAPCFSKSSIAAANTFSRDIRLRNLRAEETLPSAFSLKPGQ
jgi:hypothetical protein